ncbi:PVC-type heme-binding CxxCH protein [Fodinibius sediminis]|uniref:Putative membrane-bound dehydrogenase domain-containing protein n=1 Tax=Fodinibius sediminis TaxID=1214077 RepID=A0A521BAA9_9BACT|nr:PVC-type heme-binding CxxCH protein [Fodinibius sediminis]SMO44019.1 putative membrane-bound dehydrogenase domain-containing protein [Fodinibius sediminis]
MKNTVSGKTAGSSAKILGWGVWLMTIIIISGGCSRDGGRYEQLSDREKHSAKNALAGLETRKGLETSLFASEDMLVNPTNMDIDAEGRVWVTEGYNYRPKLNPDNPRRAEGDRIMILEDTNGDGKADTSTVFYQGNDIDAALGIMVLDERVIVSRSPYVYVFYDTDGDDKADRKEVMFSGIQGEQHDHAVHAFVFGPDGRLYFNFGNEGKTLKDADGNAVTDPYGNEIKAGGNPYRQGMVFRSDLDGRNVEVLAHNFRNNYEVAVDSYGTLWQSDNDDDGNKGVRINYVMEHGNYGYTDEVTGAGWRTRRTGMAGDIPSRHWYQHDPGSIPNLLQTGAGSPTGMAIYEGDLLPDVFDNAMIHADAGPNVIRSYPVKKEGAGYSAHIENILRGNRDQWFRPSDVTVAPDGSIFVADWYDPGVGGHQMGDQQRGRIFRIAPEGAAYRLPDFDLSSPASAVEALKNPNLNMRARAWLKLREWGAEAEGALVSLWRSENSRYRARSLWLLNKLEDKGIQYIEQALGDDNPDIRITGLRAARQLDIDIIPYVSALVQDAAPEVRREAAIALYQNQAPEAPALWAKLAMQHDGRDRWYLEALGIGAKGQWDRFFEHWTDEMGTAWNTPAGRDIIWRSRAAAALPMLTAVIQDPSIATEDKSRYFRAFHFHDSPRKEQELIGILKADLPDQQRLNIMALRQLDASAAQRSATVREQLREALTAAGKSQEYLDLVEKFQLEDQGEALLAMMTSHPDSSLGIRASRLALNQGGEPLVRAALASSNGQDQQNILDVLGNTSTPQSITMLEVFALDAQNTLTKRRQAVKALGVSWGGEQRLVELVKSGVLPESLSAAAAEALSDSWRGDVRQLAKKLSGESPPPAVELPPASELVQKAGIPGSGRKIFQQSCQICHRVNGTGTNFGPALSQIGAKLPKKGLYDAILNPSSGISFGYEGHTLTLNDETEITGIIQSETASEIVLLLPGGYTSTYAKSSVKGREQVERSLMPDNLVAGMSEQELVDLVAYLSSLK